MAKNIIRVHRPELTPEERERRMKTIEKAAENLILAAIYARKEKEA